MKRPLGPRAKPKPVKFKPVRRELAVRVKTAKRRKLASTLWLGRQLNDPYVAEAKRLGYRSRAAFKLLELDERIAFLRPNSRVIDLGCAPGGWLQVLAAKCPKGQILGIDKQEIAPVPGTTALVGDVCALKNPQGVCALLGGPADAVVSDLAAASTGHSQTDYLRVMALIETSFDLAQQLLRPGGTFVAKTLRGGCDTALLSVMHRVFAKVRHCKPRASRDDSKETFLVATGFRAGDP